VTVSDKLTPEQIGAAIEPVLQKAHEMWLEMTRAESSRVSQARYGRARDRVAAGGRVDLPYLSEEQHVELLHEIGSGALTIDPANRGSMRGLAQLRGGAVADASMFINEQEEMLASVFVPGAGKYERSIQPGKYDRSIPSHVSKLERRGLRGRGVLENLSPSRRLLVGPLETARASALATRRITTAMVGAELAEPGEIVHGELAPVAFSGARSGTPEAGREIQRRIGVIFQRLRTSIGREDIFAKAGGAALRKLSIAVERFLAAHFSPRVQDPRSVEAAGRRLLAVIVAFMKRFN